MSDIEEQVGATLAAAAEDAPDATGLAAGARRRHRVRRQRRIAVGGVAAALVVAASAVALGTRGGDQSDVVDDPTEKPSATWQTLSEGSALASIPPDWQPYSCPGHDEEPARPVYAAPGEDPCADGTGTVLYENEGPDLTVPAGVVSRLEIGGDTYWQGYVSFDRFVFSVSSRDRDLTRQILATARMEGQPEIDAAQWVEFSRGVITYQVPAFWGVGEDGDRTGYSTCVVADPAIDSNSDEQVDASHFVSLRQFGGFDVTVTAPTEAVADLVLATVTTHSVSMMGNCTPEDFNLGLLPPEGSGEPPVESTSVE
ncbi:MAG: hypothetical protein NTX33_03275 [Propionibacteriales bacterium]|nr:hypothetical protein [Propionibacteriales bacterium]